MQTQLKLGDLAVDVVRKNIKNVHLSVHPPTGRVRIAAPERMSLDTIRVFAVSKIAWIRQQQRKLLEQERESPREYLNRESHYVWGRRFLLKIVHGCERPAVEVTHSLILLHVPSGSDRRKWEDVMQCWYREELKRAVPPLIAKWERLMGVKVRHVFLQRMKTKWGSCNHRAGNIRLNTELAKKPPECLEYLVVHEMVHLHEPTHNARFVGLMDKFLPKWRSIRDTLNRLPVRHESWAY